MPQNADLWLFIGRRRRLDLFVALKVEVWDVIATQGLDNNPAPIDQTGSFEIGGGDDGNYFTDQDSDASDTSVLAAIASRVADEVFLIDSSALAAGFGPTNFVGSPTSIADFFGVAGGGVLDNSILGTITRITGVVDVDGTNDDVTIVSDDGWRLRVGGSPDEFNTGFATGGLQGPGSTDTVTLAQGMNQSFELIWFEGNVKDAQLKLTVADDVTLNPVPLPASALLLIGGLAGLGAMKRRRKS